VPHLAFIEPDRYDRLIAALDARHAGPRVRGPGLAAAGAGGVPKKRTIWPGQHVTCGICGRAYYWGGHGQIRHLMCSGARAYRCWNAATFDGTEGGRRLAEAVLSLVEALPDFDATFREKVEAATRARRSARLEALGRLDREVEAADRELTNLIDAVARMGYSPALQDRLREVEAREARLDAERADLRRRPDEAPPLPPVDELRRRAREAVGRLDFDDPEFGRLMHRLVPRIEVFPCQPLDGGAVVLRAEMTVNLAPLVGAAADGLGGLMVATATVDLFDPPQRVAYRERVGALRARGLTERAAARELGLTVTAAQRAMALQRRMQAAGVADAYRRLSAPTEGRPGRHQHPRYRFERLDDSAGRMPPGSK
jgi:hypothetical protein